MTGSDDAGHGGGENADARNVEGSGPEDRAERERRPEKGRSAQAPETADRSRATGAPAAPDPRSGSSAVDAPDPGPKADRNWTALAIALAAVSLLSAVGIVSIHDATTPALGAAILAIGFAAIVGVSWASDVDLVGAIAAGWSEHRLYAWFAAGLFGLGAVFGAVLVGVGVDLTELIAEILLEELDDELAAEGGFELTATFFIANNTPPFLAAIAGAVTVGLFTALIMLLNGVILGNLVTAMGAEAGFGLMIALIAPHAIFELTALFVAAGVGFRLLYRAGQRIAGTREALFTRAYLARAGALVLFGWLLLVLAAFVEAYLTIPIAELLFPAAAEEP